jgi:Ca2+-transporting ATPase
LKRADIGVAMGGGASIAKGNAEIVLLDDNFASLITVIEQSRLAFQNIKNAVHCALTDNMSELMAVLISLAATTIWNIPAGITIIQILAIDIVAQVFPITALGWDQPHTRFMRNKPHDPRSRNLNRKTAFEFISFGLLAASLSYANFLLYFFRHHISPEYLATSSSPYLQATILTYVTIVFCQFMNLLLVRAQGHSLFSSYLWSNKKLLAAFAMSLFCILNIVYNPIIKPNFGSGPLSILDWMTALIAAALYTAIRLFHLHTQATSRKELLRKHGHAKVRAHLQNA